MITVDAVSGPCLCWKRMESSWSLCCCCLVELGAGEEALVEQNVYLLETLLAYLNGAWSLMYHNRCSALTERGTRAN